MSNDKRPSDPNGPDEGGTSDETAEKPAEPAPGAAAPPDAVRPPDGDRVRPAYDGRRRGGKLGRKIKGYLN